VIAFTEKQNLLCHRKICRDLPVALTGKSVVKTDFVHCLNNHEYFERTVGTPDFSIKSTDKSVGRTVGTKDLVFGEQHTFLTLGQDFWMRAVQTVDCSNTKYLCIILVKKKAQILVSLVTGHCCLTSHLHKIALTPILEFSEIPFGSLIILPLILTFSYPIYYIPPPFSKSYTSLF
jgi:hypothetical protein